LPPDHEVLAPSVDAKGEAIDKKVAIEAIRAAFEAEADHPVKGREFLGVRGRADVPREGEIDYAYAVEAARAAREIIDADTAARARAAEVDERIAQVYNDEARED